MNPLWALAPPQSREAALWRALRYFEVARLLLALALVVYGPLSSSVIDPVVELDAPRFWVVSLAYLALAMVLLMLPRVPRQAPRKVAMLQMACDLAFLSWVLHAAGGVASGMAVLLYLPNAGAAILGPASLAFLFACLSVLVMLGETAWRTWLAAGDPLFVQAGLMSAGLLLTVLTMQRLAARLAAQEDLARRQGEDLRRQLLVTQMVMSELPEGVVVFTPAGQLRAINPAARVMLGGLAEPAAATEPPGLASLRGLLSAGAPARDGTELTVPVAQGARRLRVRRLGDAQSPSDVVLVLEDLGRLEERAQQLKLAAMGRLSASIAHEIRNPLAAIRHANGLLAERVLEPGLDRLTTIVEDNCRRIDRIVEDVLSTARRISAAPELLPAPGTLHSMLAEFLAQAGADPQRVRVQVSATAPIWFDAAHLRQVLVNLVGNALRHASAAPGAVQVEWAMGQSGRPCLTIADDGPGVPPALQAHVFEPFFTTESRGTGLGLHLAREFCSANGATIFYRPAAEQPPQRSAFVIEPARARTELSS